MKEQTSFQEQCEARLTGIAGVHNLELTQRTRLADGTIEATLGPLQVWIYGDGAHIRAGDRDFPYEWQAFPNRSDLLIEAFAAGIDRLLSGSEPQPVHARLPFGCVGAIIASIALIALFILARCR